MILTIATWAVMAVILFVLMFTSSVVTALGLTDDIASVVLVVSPLIGLAIGLEWLSRRQRLNR
jgi:hypothetical protein